MLNDLYVYIFILKFEENAIFFEKFRFFVNFGFQEERSGSGNKARFRGD